MYDYLTEMVEDVKQAIAENAELCIEDLLYHRNDTSEKLYDDLWVDDSVTGNASGSYTFCRATAKEYVMDNFDLITEALTEFGGLEELGTNLANDEWEFLDVTIRCYLLSDAIEKAIDELATEFVMSEE